MTFDLAQEIARANAAYFASAEQVDADNHARKFAVALRCVLDDGDREAGWQRRFVREHMWRGEEGECR